MIHYLSRRNDKTFTETIAISLKVLLPALFLSICITPGPVPAKTGNIEAHQREVAAIEKKEIEIIDALNGIDYSLNKKKRTVLALKSEIITIEKKIAANTTRSAKLNGEIRENESYASSRLVALYKLNQLGKLNYLASTDSMYQLFHRKTLLEKILDHDQKLLRDLSKSTVGLNRVTATLKVQKQKVTSLEKALTLQIGEMARTKMRRAELLDKIRNKKSLELAAIDSLKRSAEALNQKISRLKVDSTPRKDDSSTSPEIFTDLKGLLKIPVTGKIVCFYGTYTDIRFNLVNFRSGISIKADRGEPVHAVFKGTTLYASWFKGYGNMIIIDHGDHYYTVYAHAEELFKKTGDPVVAGEVIATVGDSGSMSGPGLHFEVRHHGKPIDPMQWIKKS